jgi:MFS transporter, OFA family, oxalate/formate antiporter
MRAPEKEDLASVTMTNESQTTHDFTPVEMLKTPAFYLLYVMMTMLAMGGLMATAQLGPIAKDFKVADSPVSLLGLTLAALPFALSLDRILNGLTRPFFGWVSDHLGRENTMFIAFGLEGLAIFLLITLRRFRFCS